MRIISGSAKGRKIDAPEGRNTRPTLDRVKEALFGSIQFDISGAVVLDLFSGSGNLGLEAISRGAVKAVLNDADKKAIKIIEGNVEKLGFSDSAVVTNLDYAACLKRFKKTQFNFVFLDPPYMTGQDVKAAALVLEWDMLAPNGRIIVERSLLDKTDLPGDVLSVRKYGETVLVFLGAGTTD